MRFSSRAQLLCFSLMLTFTAGLAEERKILSREKRFLGLFNLIQFPNTICNDTDNRSQGICYTRNECNSLGGNPKGECASGFGVCCIFEYTCQNMRSQAMDVVYFQNRGFPDETTVPEICIFSFSIRDPAICQLRLDFEAFTLDSGELGPETCTRDSFEIINGGFSQVKVGTLCGENTGQHIYLPVSTQQASPMVRVMISERNATAAGAKFNIKATQIDCASNSKFTRNLRAPDGCTQYYTGMQGLITSFNFSPNRDVYYGKNQDYSICFRQGVGCQLTLKRSRGVPDSSTFVGSIKTFVGVQDCAVDNGCTFKNCVQKVSTAGSPNQLMSDRLEISAFVPEADTSRSFRANAFCGSGLGADKTGIQKDGADSRTGIVVQGSGPFVLRFITDDSTPAAANPAQYELGFSIEYNWSSNCPTIVEVPQNNP